MQLTKEYKRFADYFRGIEKRVIEAIEDDEYISINTRLMLLRKYGLKNDFSLKRVLNKAGRQFPDHKDQFDKLKTQYNAIFEKLEYILPDGTSQCLDDVIDDTMYGLYLHPDTKRIHRVNIAEDSIRFAVIKEYVTSLEKVVLETYDNLLSCKGEWGQPNEEREKAHIVFFGDINTSSHSITGSPYWSNAYGRDANYEELINVFQENTDEDNYILALCMVFIDKLCKDEYSANELQRYIFPPIKGDWGDFSIVHEVLTKHNNLGFSSKVRYNDKHDMAYVYLLNNIEDPFIINQPHMSNDVCTITLVKDNERYGWKIYSIGQTAGYYKETLNLKDSTKRAMSIIKDLLIQNVIRKLHGE